MSDLAETTIAQASSAHSVYSSTHVASTSHVKSAEAFNPTHGISYRPQLPHIAIPSETSPVSSSSTMSMSNNRLSEGAVIGLIIGAIVVVFISMTAILWRHRDRSSTGDSDLEDKGDAGDLPPPYEATSAQPAIVTQYSNHDHRIHGGFSPVSNMVSSNIKNIQEHHFIPNPFADPVPPRSNEADRTLHDHSSIGDIEMKNTSYIQDRLKKNRDAPA
ncbi:hypothetical protein H0H92_014660 [Tricholoma furcatifolium]|nr:hypothetical protein H0H92_014660 [Tricholoma furcatifolium]